MTMVRGAAPARGQTHDHGRLRTAGEGRRLLQVACSACALVVSAVVLAWKGSGGQLGPAALEGPWTPEGEVVMKPGLTFNQMNELHGQLEQARWASRFGTNVPKQVSPVARVRARKQATRMQGLMSHMQRVPAA